MSRVKETTVTVAETLRARLTSPDGHPCVWRFYLDSYYFSKIAWKVVRGDLVEFVAVRQDLGDDPDEVPPYTPGVLVWDDRPMATVSPTQASDAIYFDGEDDTSDLWGVIYARFRNGGAVDLLVNVEST